MVRVRKARGVVLSVVMASGCGSEGSSAEQLQAASATEATGYATIEGVVELADNVTVEPDFDVETTLNQPPPPRECDGDVEGASWLDDGVVGAGGFSIKSAKKVEPQTHEVSIDRCRLSERILPVTVGDRIKLVNRGSYPFMPTLGDREPSKVLLKGESQSFEVTEAGMHEAHCSFTAPCGKTRVAAFHHAVHAQLGPDGRFRLTDVPAGVAVQISVWHPKLSADVQTVTLKPGETRKLKFVMQPGQADGLMVAASN